MTNTGNRLGEIDILRALAIFLVIGFHYFSRWTPPLHDVSLYPYYGKVAHWTVFRHGYLGVELFFIVSGFVIALTLERCKDLLDFIIRRLARLLPSMVVCSLITLVVIKYILPVEPFVSTATWQNILPSWTFSKPSMWASLINDPGYIDGVYWSLFVEAKFYLWSSVMYFIFRKNFTKVFFVFSLLTLSALIIGRYHGIEFLINLEKNLFFGKYAMLFAAGMSFWNIFKNQNTNCLKSWLLVLACYIAEIISLYFLIRNFPVFLIQFGFVTIFFILFAGFAVGVRLPKLYVLRVLSKVGLASYPLYLLHQNIGVALIHIIDIRDPMTMFAVVIVMIAVISIISYAIHIWIEGPGKNIVMAAQRVRTVFRPATQ